MVECVQDFTPYYTASNYYSDGDWKVLLKSMLDINSMKFSCDPGSSDYTSGKAGFVEIKPYRGDIVFFDNREEVQSVVNYLNELLRTDSIMSAKEHIEYQEKQNEKE